VSGALAWPVPEWLGHPAQATPRAGCPCHCQNFQNTLCECGLINDKRDLLDDKSCLTADERDLSHVETVSSNDKCVLLDDKLGLSNDESLLSEDKLGLLDDKSLSLNDERVLLTAKPRKSFG
jgi:hypothetical protein